MAPRFAGNTGRKRRSADRARRNGARIAQACRIEALEGRQMLTLTIDLRLADGGGKTAEITAVEQTISMNVYAMVSGNDANSPFEGVQSVMGKFLSSNLGTGSAQGVLSAYLASPFDSFASSTGFSRDLDGDGDLDIGSNNDDDSEHSSDFFIARTGAMQFGSKDSKGVPTTRGPREFLIGTVDFYVTQLLPGTETDIVFVRRQRPEGGLWAEDAFASRLNASTGTMVSGAPIRLTRTDAAGPQAALFAPAVVDGTATYDFTVTYTDDLSVNRATIGDGDVVVTDPSGQPIAATLVAIDQPTNGPQLVATYRINAPGGTWDGAKNGTYRVAIVANQVRDDAGKAVTAGNPSTFVVNLPVPEGIPTATFNAPAAAVGGAANLDFTVTYNDDNAVVRNTLGEGDVSVTGPDGQVLKAVLVSADQAGDAAQIVATYRVNAPGGMWDATRNGTYAVAIGAGQVNDVGGKSVATGAIGTFAVKVAYAVLTPKGLLRVIGSNKNDKLLLWGKRGGTYVQVNKVRYSFSTTAVKKVQVYAMGGNDRVQVYSGVIGCLLDGGAGRDTVIGGDGADAIYVRDKELDTVNGGKGKNSARVDKRLDSVTNVQVFLR